MGAFILGIAVAVLVLTAFTNPYFFLKSSGKAFGEKEYRQVRKELRIVAWVLITTICCAALVAAWFYLSEPPNRL